MSNELTPEAAEKFKAKVLAAVSPSGAKLTEIKNRWAVVTPGEWRWKDYHDSALLYAADPEGLQGQQIIWADNEDGGAQLKVSGRDKEAIRLAPQDVAWLVSRAECLETELRHLYAEGCILPWNERKKWTRQHGMELGSALARVTRFLERE